MTEHPFADRAARVLRTARANVGPRAAVDPATTIAALADSIRASARRRRRVHLAVAAGAIALASAAAVVLLVRASGSPGSGMALRSESTARSPVPGPAPAPSAAPGGASLFTLRDATPQPEEPARSAAADVGPWRGGLARAAPGAGRAPALFVSGSATRVAVAGASFTSGDTLTSGDATLALTAGDGTEVRLAARSEIALVRADAIRWFQLQTGSLYAHVAKLGDGERFVVATPDRQIEVHGTKFRVSLVRPDAACGGGTITRVAVEEGVVTVRAPGGAELRVAAGGRWPADCPDRPPPTEDAARDRASPHTGGLGPRPARRAPAELAAPSTLGAENDLFGRAARAERAGDAVSALRLLEQLIARYPASPLREAAEAERLRISAGASTSR